VGPGGEQCLRQRSRSNHGKLRRGTSQFAAWLFQAALLLTLAAPALAATLKKGPYLLYSGDPTTMSVLWQSDAAPTASSIEWGLTPDCTAGAASGRAFGSDFQFETTLTGLIPGALYYYRVRLDGLLLAGSFRAAPPVASTRATFYIYGDSRSNPAMQDTVTASLMRDMRADPNRRQGLILHVGDATRDGTVEANWTTDHFPRTRPHLLDYQANMATAILRGNHDGTSDPALFRKYYPYRYADRAACYYAFDWGPIHFAIVDDQAARAPGSPQYSWLAGDLSTSLQPWKVVAWHMPAYGSGAHASSVTNQLLTSYLVEPTRVAMVVAGHNHDYVRAEKGGVIHLTVGGGGAPLYSCTSPTPPFVKVCRSTFCFARVDIDGCRLTLTGFDQSGAVIDSADYSRPGCACDLRVSVSPEGPAVVSAGGAATLSATAAGGKGPYTYQWKEDGSALTGATASTCTVTKGSAQDHVYNCEVTDSSGTCSAVCDSASATLSWRTPETAGVRPPTDGP